MAGWVVRSTAAWPKRIQFNEDTLWTGNEDDTGRYQNFRGDVHHAGGPSGRASATDSKYRRRLDIEKAIHTISYELGGVQYRREYFASHPANVLMFRFTADKEAYTGTVSLKNAHEDGTHEVVGNTINFGGKLGDFHFELRSPSRGSERGRDHQRTPTGSYRSKGCDSLIILLDAGTDLPISGTRVGSRSIPHQRITERLAAAIENLSPTCWRNMLRTTSICSTA